MRIPFTIDEEIFINQYTQHINSLKKLDEWFNLQSVQNKKNTILNVLDMVIQAHPTYDEISLAACTLNKRNSSSATKLLNQNKPYYKYGYELIDFPEQELLNSFNILLVTLSIADSRRKREECANGCTHWWHQDLSNELILRQLKECK